MFRDFVKNIARQSGYEILGPTRAYAAERSLVGLFQLEQINLVIDVGANIGQFASELRAGGYTGRITSFEPLADAHDQLCTRARHDPNWTIAARTAIGNHAGSIQIHISANSVSSSILNIMPEHVESEPASTYVGAEQVPLNRLDDLCELSAADSVALKIDVQGYEQQVFEGASTVLARCRVVIVEMSLVSLYDGQTLVMDLWVHLAKNGFEPWSLEPGFRNPETGRMLQCDGVFVRSRPGSLQSGSTSQGGHR